MTDTASLAAQIEALAAKATPGTYDMADEGSAFWLIHADGIVIADCDYTEINTFDQCSANAGMILALLQNLPAIIAALRATEPAQVADADREATVDDINWPDDDGGERYLPESEVERLVAQGRAEAELAVAEADLTHAYLSGHAKGVVETEAQIVAWLRKDDFLLTADAIERGEHKQEIQ